MIMYYSGSERGFYEKEIHGDKIPSDAVEISIDLYEQLLDGQSAGKVINSGDDSVPYLSDPLPPTSAQLSTSARLKRDKLIASTDYLVMPDYPISVDLLARVKAYRQALRDITEQAGFPSDIDWPVNPMDEVPA